MNIEVLRENVRTYQDLKRTLESVKKRMEKLEKIDHLHSDVEECMRKDSMYEFYLSQADVDISGEHIQSLEREIRTEERRKADAEE